MGVEIPRIFLEQEGKIRHIGLSNVDPGQLTRAQTMVKVVSVQTASIRLSRQEMERIG
jgi:diketogulonate reductase-like aldo/keto reductase